MRDIIELRDAARAARLAQRVIIEPDPLYLDRLVDDLERDVVLDRLAVYVGGSGPQCACGNLVTITDLGRKCRECRRSGR